MWNGIMDFCPYFFLILKCRCWNSNSIWSKPFKNQDGANDPLVLLSPWWALLKKIFNQIRFVMPIFNFNKLFVDIRTTIQTKFQNAFTYSIKSCWLCDKIFCQNSIKQIFFSKSPMKKSFFLTKINQKFKKYIT